MVLTWCGNTPEKIGVDILFDNEREKDIYRERFDKNIALQYGINDFEKLHSDIERNKELGDKNGR